MRTNIPPATVQRFFDKFNRLVNDLPPVWTEESLSKVVSAYADIFVMCSHGLPVADDRIWILNSKIKEKFGQNILTMVKVAAKEVFYKSVAAQMCAYPEFEALLEKAAKEVEEENATNNTGT